MQRVVRYALALGLLGMLVPAFAIAPVVAADAVVDGDCEEADFDAALAIAQTGGGGTITFDCGGPTTISFTSEKLVTVGNSVVIDGGFQTIFDATVDDQRHFTVAAGSSLELLGVRLISADTNGDGGSIFNAGTLIVRDSSFDDNHTTDGGGAIYNVGSLTVERTVIGQNSADSGGAIVSLGSGLSISDSSFIGNTSTGFLAGALFYAAPGTGTISNTSFVSNETASFGGALVSGNGTLMISGSTFNQNTAAGTGGAIFNTGTVNITVTNSTFSGNTAALGGAIFSNGSATTTLIASTVVDNTSNGDTNTDSGSLDNDQGGTITLQQTIVANDTAGFDCFGTMTSNDYNLASDNSCNLFGANDNPGVDPDLGPLGDNGGPTETHVPNPGSPAIDDGGATCPEVDQRGYPRPAGSACDIGSVEYQVVSYVFCASRHTGQVMSPPSGICSRGYTELEVPSEEPTTYCISRSTGALSYAADDNCSGSSRPHLMPDDGPLWVCVSRHTGAVRAIAEDAVCRGNERSRFVPPRH